MLIATHFPKFLNARLKQPGFLAKITDGSQDVVSSATTNLRRSVWGCPEDAAMMKSAREIASDKEDSWVPDESLPSIFDPSIKQLIIPQDNWKDDGYISVTPVASLGLAYEIFCRLRDQNFPYLKHIVQPIPAARSNHGETLLMQGGFLRLMKIFPKNVVDDSFIDGKIPVVSLQCRVQRMNVGGGMVCVGFPAITAIGGLVHSIEREIGSDLEFAFGMESSSQLVAPPLIGTPRGSYLTNGPVRAGKKYGIVNASVGYCLDEIQANTNCTLLVRSREDVDIESIRKALCSVRRIAGGSIFEEEVKILYPGDSITRRSFISDATSNLRRKIQSSGDDALGSAISECLDGVHGLTMTGYALLESPQKRHGARGNYKHAWSEPVFSLFSQGILSSSSWWTRRNLIDGSIIWIG